MAKIRSAVLSVRLADPKSTRGESDSIAETLNIRRAIAGGQHPTAAPGLWRRAGSAKALLTGHRDHSSDKGTGPDNLLSISIRMKNFQKILLLREIKAHFFFLNFPMLLMKKIRL